MTSPLPMSVQQFLDQQLIATLATQVSEKGDIHIASVAFCHDPATLACYFVTKRDSEKCTLLREEDNVYAACNIGTVAGTPLTVQMRGTVSYCR